MQQNCFYNKQKRCCCCCWSVMLLPKMFCYLSAWWRERSFLYQTDRRMLIFRNQFYYGINIIKYNQGHGQSYYTVSCTKGIRRDEAAVLVSRCEIYLLTQTRNSCKCSAWRNIFNLVRDYMKRLSDVICFREVLTVEVLIILKPMSCRKEVCLSVEVYRNATIWSHICFLLKTGASVPSVSFDLNPKCQCYVRRVRDRILETHYENPLFLWQ